MRTTVITFFIAVLLIVGVFVPVKTIKTGGSCPDVSSTQRHNLILGDKLPKAEIMSLSAEGCAPLVKHQLYLL